MPQNRFRRNGRAALLAAIAVAYPVAGYSAPAARVDFAVGNVTAIAPSGQSRALAKGAPLNEGETINTNNGRAQLRFTDGAYVSLQPESQFRIDQYRFEGKVDGSEKGLFSLLKGGLRTITGLVGRSNRKNYQVSTSVATIGIRGTEYTIQYGKSISGTVGEGEIEVCNGAGCLSVTDGESYYVQNQDVRPVLTDKRTDLPPPPPQNPPANFAEGNNTDPGGNALPGFILTGTYVSPTLAGAYAANIGGVLLDSASAATFDASGGLTQLGGVTFNVNGATPATPVTNGGNDGFIAWGTFVNTLDLFTYAYVVGVATPAIDISSLAAGNMKATYALTGSTPVIGISGAVTGSLNSASLTAAFGGGRTPALAADMYWTIGGASVLATLSGSATGSGFTLSGSCAAGCKSVQADGAFLGPKALRAGFAYVIDVNQWGGAAVFSQASLK